jgi:hypothetical protein
MSKSKSKSAKPKVKEVGRQFPFWLLPADEANIEAIKAKMGHAHNTDSIRFALRKVAEECQPTSPQRPSQPRKRAATSRSAPPNPS